MKQKSVGKLDMCCLLRRQETELGSKQFISSIIQTLHQGLKFPFHACDAESQLPILLLNGKLFCTLATLVFLLSLICTFLCAFELLALSDREPNS